MERTRNTNPIVIEWWRWQHKNNNEQKKESSNEEDVWEEVSKSIVVTDGDENGPKNNNDDKDEVEHSDNVAVTDCATDENDNKNNNNNDGGTYKRQRVRRGSNKLIGVDWSSAADVRVRGHCFRSPGVMVGPSLFDQIKFLSVLKSRYKINAPVGKQSIVNGEVNWF